MSLNLVKYNCLTVFIFLTAMSQLALAGSVGGSDGAGGGDVNSGENYSAYTNYNNALLEIKTAFESKEIQKTVAAFADSRLYIEISDKSSAEEKKAKLLAEQGLASEILNSTYVFKDKCFEQNTLSTGKTELVETDASTLRGVKLAEICLSRSRLVRRLAQDFKEGKDEFYTELKGLIYHENARHFLLPGENDTEYLTSEDGEKFRIHPLAMYVQNHSLLQRNAYLTKLNDGAYMSLFKINDPATPPDGTLVHWYGFNPKRITSTVVALVPSINRESLQDLFLVAHINIGKDCSPAQIEVSLSQADQKASDQTKVLSYYWGAPDVCSKGFLEIVNKRTQEHTKAGELNCGGYSRCNLLFEIFGSYNFHDLKPYWNYIKAF